MAIGNRNIVGERERSGAGLGRGGDGSVGGGSIAAVRQQLVHVLLAELSTGEKEISLGFKDTSDFQYHRSATSTIDNRTNNN